MYIKCISLVCLVFFSYYPVLKAQDIPYATGKWNANEFGNHRAVLVIEDNEPLVGAHLPWRRMDDPAKKSIIVVDAATGKKVPVVYTVMQCREYGDIVFEPTTGSGVYYVYYMPFKTTGSWYFPNTVYYSSEKQKVPQVINSTIVPAFDKLPKARVSRFEAIDEFNSFYPMEIPAVAQEVNVLLEQNKQRDFVVFGEDRKYPIRMDDNIPFRWINKDNSAAFAGTAQRNEFYVYQLGVFAAFRDVQNISIRFSDLHANNGKDRITASAMRCFNLYGKDWLGKSFTKKISIKKGQVQALWIGIDISTDVSPGEYRGTVNVQGDGLKTEQVGIHLTVEDKIIVNRGYNDLFRMSRLNWLDSDVGLGDNVFKPFNPVILKHQTVEILGRTLQFGNNGLPEKITSTFSGNNDKVDGKSKEILASPVQMVAIANDKKIVWKTSTPKIIQKTSGAVAWTTTLHSGGMQMNVYAKMECDGYINYEITINAKNPVTIDDIQLLIPYAKPVAKYMMGLGFKGGLRPDSLKWKWEKSSANNMVWVGDVNAGMQCKLKHETPDWALYNLDKTGLYKDWGNDGSGGCELSENGNSFLFKAFTGKKMLQPGSPIHLNFGLLITPIKTLDYNHFTERYFQSDPPVTNWMKKAVSGGANVMNIHQGNILNPYINYPFVATDTLTNYVTALRHNNIRAKVYYTVRELSNRTAEIWALRSLGEEIYTPGIGAQLADQFADDGTGGNLYSTGGSWLVEHLRKNYDAAWHNPLENGDLDMSIRTQGLSRWHNYYLEGLGWLAKNTGIRGIYLDGVGYDREIMKRVRKVLDRSADSCLIDFHSGNNFEPTYGLGSPANTYMELFSSINSLWLGEMYNYDESPEYWMVEIAGIPYGLFGEMLSNCGNPYRGMIFGMTSRLGWGACDPSAVWNMQNAFGIKDAEMIGYWDEASPVKSNIDDVKTTIYKKADKVLIAYAGWGNKALQLKMNINWKALNMDPAHVKIEAPGINGFQEQKTFTSLDKIEVPAGKGGIIIIEKN